MKRTGSAIPSRRRPPTRVAIANDFLERFHYDIPLFVDPIENLANAAYAGWPERLYVVDETGTIVYKGKPGPFGYHPDEVEAWLKATLRLACAS